jgi:uncharacterized membrane-anchored protein
VCLDEGASRLAVGLIVREVSQARVLDGPDRGADEEAVSGRGSLEAERHQDVAERHRSALQDEFHGEAPF